MPRKPKDLTLAWLIAEDTDLAIACLTCGRRKVLSPLEAVASYGGLLTFIELRSIIWARCSVDECQATVEPTLRRYYREGGK